MMGQMGFNDLPRVSPGTARAPGELGDVARKAERLLNQTGRRRSTLRLIYDELEPGSWVASGELVGITHRFSARIYDLRALGCAIETETDESGVTWFRMTKGLQP
jgi:hypothetical protein